MAMLGHGRGTVLGILCLIEPFVFDTIYLKQSKKETIKIREPSLDLARMAPKLSSQSEEGGVQLRSAGNVPALAV